MVPVHVIWSIFFWIHLLSGLLPLHAEEAVSSNLPLVAVGDPRIKRIRISFENVSYQEDPKESPTQKAIGKTKANEFKEMITKDFNMMGAFEVKPFQNQESDFILTASYSQSTEDRQVGRIELKLQKNKDQKTETIFFKRYRSSFNDLSKSLQFGMGEVLHQITGGAPLFQTQIAMTCDGSGKKEIYVSDFFGTDVRQVTHHHSLAFSPAWSPNNRYLAYSVFTKRSHGVKNIDLYEFDLISNTVRPLSRQDGINSGAAYSPDGRWLAFTKSSKKNLQLFLMDRQSGSVAHLAPSSSIDVDPSWSPDSQWIAFTSSRTGLPMIFKIELATHIIQRLTYAGKFNATPCWSPNADEIAFSGWSESGFDQFLMRSDGTHLEKITDSKKIRSKTGIVVSQEDPSFSPDGHLLAISSNEAGKRNIYIQNLDGTYKRRLTYGLGNCSQPKWSNPPSASGLPIGIEDFLEKPSPPLIIEKSS